MYESDLKLKKVNHECQMPAILNQVECLIGLRHGTGKCYMIKKVLNE
jgi:hypothetical protein